MSIQDYNKAIVLLIHVIVMNNAFGVARVLKNQGYDKKDYIPSGDIETALLQLYILDRDRFFRALRSIEWNPGHIATNQQQISGQLMKLAAQSGIEVNNTNWWKILVGFISVSAPLNTK